MDRMIKNIYIKTLSYVLYLLMVIINKTIKFNFVGIEQIKDNALFAVWHRVNFILFYANPFEKMAVLTTKGVRGEILSGAGNRFDSKIIKTSFDENPKEAAVAAIQLINCLKEGYGAVIAVDGPQGPLYNVKPGIFFLADKSGKKIIPVGVAYSNKIELAFRWDKYIIPLPFSRIIVYLDSSYVNNGDAAGLKQAMIRAEDKAKELLKS